MVAEAAPTAGKQATQKKLGWVPALQWFGRPTLVIASLLLGLLVWILVSRQFNVTVFPSPSETLIEARRLYETGELASNVGISLFRILTGFVAASAVAIPLGMAMGRIPYVRSMMAPIVEYLRFIPAIALTMFAVLWFGIGELSKIFLVFYTTVFLVIINTEAGVYSIPTDRIRAASSLGAGRAQMFVSVILPSIVPFLSAGMRIAMGRSFMTIVAAEILAAETGIGAMIFRARLYSKMDTIFVGLAILGLMGLIVDRVFRWLSEPFERAYG